ncbi:3-keto-disaccharide hydrolase [Runella sp.]|uniref:3-keto-disaccharide hydrolase n=1 Tax=Runella sp. TaxID=1960881 RepID=UPI003D14BF65
MAKYLLIYAAAGMITLTNFFLTPSQKTAALFDGKSFKGWEGDTVNTWRIENGAIVGGSLVTKVPHNDFLCTKRSYSNFILKVKFKLSGTEGFINSGVQFRSKRLTDPAYEMTGYQADLGDNYWASLYDESRRNKTLIAPEAALVKKILKPGDWNDFEVRAENRRIRIFLNGQQTVDYTEPDETIPQTGIIGLQIHGGGKAEVAYKDIIMQELN